jgi:hypothetical protein
MTAKFLIRDDEQLKGYIEFTGALPRTREFSFVPWAITNDGRVVYAPSRQYRNRPSRGGLRPYDTTVSQMRRRLCQTALGSMALTSEAWTQPAVSKVSVGVKKYLTRKIFADPNLRERYAANVGKYMYGTKYRSFGRFSDAIPSGTKDHVERRIWGDALNCLDDNRPIERVMSIHDGVGKLLMDGDPQKTVYETWLSRLRPDRAGELFDPAARGRDKVPDVRATTTAGIVDAASRGLFPELQSRNRGVDMYRRTVPHFSAQEPVPDTARTELSGVVYYRDLDTRNELFGAGPSGTTGTLIAAAKAFGDLSGELLRQYLLAIMGYLVGGGMHSLHESLTVMGHIGETGFEYHSSSMLGYTRSSELRQTARSDVFPTLPQTFQVSTQFAKWRDDYYDVVVLGGIHWMFNSR